MKRDGATNSFWENQIHEIQNPEVTETVFDAVIVGGGITGMSTAIELQKRGKSVLVLEKENLGFGTTGGTTAHINNFFDASYDEIISDFGEENAKIIADSAKNVVKTIKRNIEKFQIACEFAECNFYLFSTEEDQNKILDSIFEAHQKVGIETKKVYEIPFPLEFENAIEIKGQGQFHPIKYINGLAKAFVKNGGKILTNQKVISYKKDGENLIIETENGEKFTAKNLIWATHIPPGNNRFSLLVAPYRSYALSAKLENPPKNLAQTSDLYDPYHYMRYHKSGDDFYLIAGGFDHKTGHEEAPEKCFEDLEKYVNENFRLREITSKWSSQYYVPADGLPYIGEMPGEENVYISTGYNGNGMTFGTLAGEIISDLIERKKSDLAKIFSPNRVKPVSSAKSVIQEGADAMVHFVKDKFSSEKISDFSDVENGEGKIVKIHAETIAVYKDEKGGLHLLNPVCPHMGCNVLWNSAEKSWDCPCHGSRFDIDGKLLNGPALKGLEKVAN